MLASRRSSLGTNSPSQSPPPTAKDNSLFGETLVRLNQVPQLLPPKSDGRRVGISTVYRWVARGVRGTRLETVSAPWGQITSKEAVERFLTKLSPSTVEEHRRHSTRRRREQAAASLEVNKALGLACPEIGHRPNGGVQ